MADAVKDSCRKEMAEATEGKHDSLLYEKSL